MIGFTRTQDPALIKAIVTHPKVYPAVSDDAAPAPSDWQPLMDERFWYVVVADESGILGLFSFFPENAATWKVHTCLLPAAYGAKARMIARALPPWVWANTTFARVITDVPDYNRLALFFALQAGLTPYGVNQKSFVKDGALHDQVVLGISRPKETACQS